MALHARDDLTLRSHPALAPSTSQYDYDRFVVELGNGTVLLTTDDWAAACHALSAHSAERRLDPDALWPGDFAFLYGEVFC